MRSWTALDRARAHGPSDRSAAAHDAGGAAADVALLDQLDDPRLTPNEDLEIRRRLREEISLLWRT